MFTLTKTEALRIQAEHVAWYGKLYPEIAVADYARVVSGYLGEPI